MLAWYTALVIQTIQSCISLFADWVEDAFEEVFHAPQRQQEAEPKHVTVEGGVGVEVGNGAVEVTMDVEVDTTEGVWLQFVLTRYTYSPIPKNTPSLLTKCTCEM